MVGCTAVGCTNRSERGMRMYGFPKDTARRKIWLAQVRRRNLTITTAQNNRKLCAAHFERGQFTKTHSGRVRLRADAVPTIFAHRPQPRRWKDPAKRSTAELPQHVDPLTSDHTYCAKVKFGIACHVPMDDRAFERWLESVSATFLSLNDQQRNVSLDYLISLSGAAQLRHLSNGLETLLKRDFLRLLPLELAFYLLQWLDPQTLLTCCLVCKQWNKVINSCTEVWQGVCQQLGWRIDESIQDASHWKGVYLKAKLRMMQLKDQEAFVTSSLIGHSARVYALYYKDGLLCTGSDDLSAKLWDVRTGQCIYGIQTHTCATVKFDEQKLVTGSFDNTIACWEWSTGAKIQQFRGHTGAVFSVDYNDELDVLVSGSADFSVKVWSLSAGACLNTLTGHTEWVTKVILQKSEVESMVHSPGDYILLSADKYEIKVWPLGREINCKCLKTLSVSENRSITLQPRLQFDGRYIVCSSDLGVYQWDFASFEILRVIKMPDPANLSLLSFGEVFALLFDNHFLYVMDLRTEVISGRFPLPAYRKSKRGSSFLAGVTSWLNGLDGCNDSGLVFATSMPDHSIHLVLWKENG